MPDAEACKIHSDTALLWQMPYSFALLQWRHPSNWGSQLL